MKEVIEESVIQAFHKARDQLLNVSTGSRIRTFHVSDFISPCLKKVWYQKNNPKKMEEKTKNVLYHGLIVHEHSQLSHFHEVTMCYDIEKDIGYTPQEVEAMDVADTKQIITGTLDDLLKVGDQYVIADKKTFSGHGYYKKTEPDASYAQQLAIYRVLLEKSYGIDAKWGCLLYLDKGADLEETSMAFELPPLEETKKFLKETMSTLRGVVPKPTINWLCNGENKKKKIFCPYLDQCNREGRLADEPPKIADKDPDKKEVWFL